jgi:urease accessory protein
MLQHSGTPILHSATNETAQETRSPFHWSGRLRLRFERRSDQTILAERRHHGPFLVQKPLYPEGPGICYAVLLHPPGALAAGDHLELSAEIGAGAHALLTTPEATKWYKAPDASASQEIRLDVGRDAKLDWLPRENILFDQARPRVRLVVSMHPGATAIGWESMVLGREASGERWRNGFLRSDTEIRDSSGKPLLIERSRLNSTSPLLSASPGLAGFSVFGTLWAVATQLTQADVERIDASCRFARDLRAGASLLPGGLLVIRALATKIELLRQALINWWTLLRPIIHGTPAQSLRLWSI